MTDGAVAELEDATDLRPVTFGCESSNLSSPTSQNIEELIERLDKMSKEKKYHYVYKHVCPMTDALLYVGCGSRSRAWTQGTLGSNSRVNEHVAYLEMLNENGYFPPDWATLVETGLTKREAYTLEQALIRELSPTFNKPQGLALLRMVDEKVDEAKRLRDEGWTYKAIAEIMGVSPNTVSNALNGKIKNAKGYKEV